jgi:hypothetical protein
VRGTSETVRALAADWSEYRDAIAGDAEALPEDLIELTRSRMLEYLAEQFGSRAPVDPS